MILRDYQETAIEGMRLAFRRKLTRVVLYSPTGSGKTVMAMQIIKAAQEKGTRVMFVCNRIGLVVQASREFEKYGIPHGIVQGQNTRDLHSPVLVASIQSLNSRGYPSVGLIVIDECHGVAGSKEYKDLLEVYNAVPVVGLTATPFSKGLGKRYEWGTLFEDLVCAATIPDLIAKGNLVDVDIFSPGGPDLSAVPISKGDYEIKPLGVAVDKPSLVGDIVAHWHRLGRNRPTVCFATNIAHSKHIVERFIASGVTAEHIDCYTEEAERKEILRRVDEGITKVISNVAILAEGWDQPSVEVMICARPTKSLIRWIQMAGRILRPFPGKERGLILDHSGTAKELGYPTEELPLILDDGKAKEAKEAKPKEKVAKVCPACQFLKPAGEHKCSHCGFVPERQNEVVAAPGVLSKLERKKKSEYTTEQKRQLYRELKSLAVERSWSKGRLAHVFQDLTGVWPNAYQQETPLPVSLETKAKVQHLAIKFAKSKAKPENRPEA